MLNAVYTLRQLISQLKVRLNVFRRIQELERQINEIKENLYYELKDPRLSFPDVMDMEETLRMIIDRRLSVCRYGDGEFEMTVGTNMSFQKFNPKMQQRLQEILQNPIENCLCCLPNIYASLALYVPYYQTYWRRVALWSRQKVLPLISPQYVKFGNAEISRPYMGMRDKTLAPKIFHLWKELIADKRILIVEGRYSRLGIGNDLFDGVKSIRRIWCPPTNAFEFYDEILSTIEAKKQDADMIILALGGVATILAYDLAEKGCWAIDAGHIDVEYCWMKMGALQKVPIPGKYVNECADSGREMIQVAGEDSVNNVVAMIGVK